MNNKRTNPFRTIDKNNFPPLDDFFLGTGRPPTAPAKLASPDESFCSNKSSTVSPTICNDFILDMSIAGRAAMAEHNSRVRKYGIDGDNYNSPSDRNSSLSDSDDWGRLMDDTCTEVSFSSSAYVNNPLNVSRDRSRYADTSPDISSSYFDKSVIHSLLTPEKVRSQSTDGLTLKRGALYSNDDSPNSLTSGCCTNIGSRCSDVEEMFHAALRFHNDLQESGDSNNGKDKSSSVSFAADTSFLGGEGRSIARRKRPGDRHNMEELNFLFGSPINKNDESFVACSSFFGSPISPSLSGVESEMKHSPSSSLLISNKSSLHIKTTPSGAGGQINIDDQSASFPSILGFTPVQSELENDDSIPKKNLFQSEAEPIMTVECAITEDSIELVHRTPNKLKSRNNNIQTMVRSRMFGLDAASRFNQCSNDREMQDKTPNIDLRPKLPHDVSNALYDENVRGVRLCRASKLKAMGLESSVCSSWSWSSHDHSADNSDF